MSLLFRCCTAAAVSKPRVREDDGLEVRPGGPAGRRSARGGDAVHAVAPPAEADLGGKLVGEFWIGFGVKGEYFIRRPGWWYSRKITTSTILGFFFF